MNARLIAIVMVSFSFVMAGCGSNEVKPYEVPAEKAFAVTPPGADVPKGCAVFSGGWSGEWRVGGVGRSNLWVTSIDKECNATISYGRMGVTQSKIVDGTLQEFMCNPTTNGRCTFKISNDGNTLSASYWNPQGGRNYATFSRIIVK